MKTIIILTAILLISSSLFPTTWIINQDGTGHFTTISAGITAAVNGDVLLVHPGIYYERINYQGKNITITSLYDGIQYGNSYITNTIIDGSHEGTVVTISSNETRNAVLNGFTIRHGRGEDTHVAGPFLRGGGMFIRHASPVISNCIIENNFASMGSGIAVMGSGSPLLMRNTIRHNHSLNIGAVFTQAGTNMELCSENLNSIYLNYAPRGCDLFIFGIANTTVHVDTFTVFNPDMYFVQYDRPNIPEFNIVINHAKIEPVAADLYVDPGGSDTNSGLTSRDPLRTIAMAITKIAPDGLVQRTVHVAEGVYSPSLNNQLFPVSLRSNVALIGADRSTTILDGDNSFPILHAQSHGTYWGEPVRNLAVKNFTLVNGSNHTMESDHIIFSLTYVSDIEIENIDITGSNTNGMMKMNTAAVGNSILKNIHIYDNMGGLDLYIYHLDSEYDLYAENIRIRNNAPLPLPYPEGGSGTGMAMGTKSGPPITLASRATILNLEVSGNQISNVPGYWVHNPYGNLEIAGAGTIRVVNSTVGDNSSTNQRGGGLTFGTRLEHLELFNTIVYGNTPHNIAVENLANTQGNVYISHCLIGGGEEGIHYYDNPNTVVHWGEGNLDADPLWMGDANPEYPYMLSENSPARNAGTFDIPDFVFPTYDLAGNPRISEGMVDIGAYEYQGFGTGIEDDLLPELTDFDYNLFNYPNPVVSLQSEGRRGGSTGTSISFQLPKDGHVAIDIYNLKGQFVRRVIDAYMRKGEHNAFWNGRDELERYVATGFYMYKLEIDGRMVATGRCTFIK